MPKMVQFWRVFENLKLAVKQSYQTGQFKQVKNWWKMPKLKNSNATFKVIFKHRGTPVLSACIWKVELFGERKDFSKILYYRSLAIFKLQKFKAVVNF